MTAFSNVQWFYCSTERVVWRVGNYVGVQFKILRAVYHVTCFLVVFKGLQWIVITVTMKMEPGTLQTTNIKIPYLLALYLPILISSKQQMLYTQLVIYTTKRSINFVKHVLVAKNVRVLNAFGSPSLRKFRNLNICKIQQPKQSVGNWKNVMPQRIRRYPNKGSDYSILLTITSNWSRRIGNLIGESKSKHYKNNQGILKLHV